MLDISDPMYSHERADAALRRNKADELTVTIGPLDEQPEIVTSLDQPRLN
jgi:hypothetical protein